MQIKLSALWLTFILKLLHQVHIPPEAAPSKPACTVVPSSKLSKLDSNAQKLDFLALGKNPFINLGVIKIIWLKLLVKEQHDIAT